MNTYDIAFLEENINMNKRVGTLLLILSIIVSGSIFVIINDISRQRSITKNLLSIGYVAKYEHDTFLDCANLSNTPARDCFITYYLKQTTKDKVEVILNDIVVKVKDARYPTFYSTCHQVTHALGVYTASSIYKDFPLAAMKLEPQVCATGFTHGVFQAYWGSYSKEKMNNSAGHACSDLGITVGYYRWTCNHILGHELVDRDPLNPGPQIRNCVNIKDINSRNDCYSGGWMQFFSNDAIIAMFKNKNYRENNIFAYCNKEVEASLEMCYQETFPALAAITNGNFSEDFKMCSKAINQAGFMWCSYGVGRSIAVSSGYDMHRAVIKCQENSGLILDYCLASAAASVTLNSGSAKDSIVVCDYITTPEIKNYCKRWVEISRGIQEGGPNASNLPII